MLSLLILLASLLLQLFFPWWIIAPIAFVLSALKARSAGQAFGQAFAAIFLLWGLVALYRTVPNENLLASRVGEMFMLQFSGNWIVLLILTAVIGGLVSGCAGLAGYFAQSVFMDKQTRRVGS